MSNVRPINRDMDFLMPPSVDEWLPQRHLARFVCIGAAIIMPAVNSEAMAEHLREISTQVAPGAHAVLVLDGAGWHQAGERLPVPDNISLLTLPPYSGRMREDIPGESNRRASRSPRAVADAQAHRCRRRGDGDAD